MGKLVKMLIAGASVALITYLLLSTLSSSQRYLSPWEVLAGDYEGRTVAVIGRVVERPRYEESSLVFKIADDQATLNVRYQGPQVSISEGIDVVVEGVFRLDEVVAVKILTKCPSRYGEMGGSLGNLSSIVIPLAIGLMASVVLAAIMFALARRKKPSIEP